MSVDLGGQLYKEALKIYKKTLSVLNPEWVHYNQLANSVSSIVANIAEGNGRRLRSFKYYLNFLLTARGSAYETIAWLDILAIYSGTNLYTIEIQEDLEKMMKNEIPYKVHNLPGRSNDTGNVSQGEGFPTDAEAWTSERDRAVSRRPIRRRNHLTRRERRLVFKGQHRREYFCRGFYRIESDNTAVWPIDRVRNKNGNRAG